MHVTPLLKWGARTGYAARGVVYLVVGIFAILAAAGGSEAEGTQGALQKLVTQPLGEVLLAIVGLGLLAFAAWRFAQAIGDFDDHGTSAKGLVIRVGLFGSGLAHLGLAAFVAGILLSIGGSESGDPTGGWLSGLFGTGLGRWVALLLAAVPIGVGVAHIVKGLRAGYEKYLKVDDRLMTALKPVCSFGLISRGVLFVIVGGLAAYAGGIYDAKSAPGLSDALSFLQRLPFGTFLFLLVALGLLAFAIYSFIEAAYRRVAIDEQMQV